VFIELKGKKCIIIGGGEVAARKAETLIRFEPDITVVSPLVVSKIKELFAEGKLKIVEREFVNSDIDGAFMVIAATSDKNVNNIIYEQASKKAILADIADSPEKCSFVFPSIVKRGELVLGISTSGIYPALSKRLRKEIEDIIPEGIEAATAVLKESRQKIKSSTLSKDKKDEVLNRILDLVYKCNGISEGELRLKINKIIEEYV
jgi:precorrin-2 dehydrogenase/sirohydrochlorin ferrochelatase